MRVNGHGGDERGSGPLLARVGSRLRPDALRDLLRGVAAAPEGHDADAWMSLLGPDLSADARATLRQLLVIERAGAQSSSPTPHATRLAALRAELRRRRLAGFVVPRGDEHQGEYVARHSERLAWLTGFTGSAGTAVVLRDKAALFVDGRYTTQSAEEVDAELFVVRHTANAPVAEWLGAELPAGARLGYDPWLHTARQVAELEKACRHAQARAVPVDGNPVDAVWTDRPPPPLSPIVPHALANTPPAEKRERIAETLRRDRHDAVFLAQPDCIAWLLDVRGGDVAFTPIPLAFALLHADAGVELFVDPRKVTAAARAHLGGTVSVSPPEMLGEALDRLGAAQRTVRIDPDGAPEWVVRRLRTAGAAIAEAVDPCVLPKATKTPAELAGIRDAHVRDGVALSRFLAWLPGAWAAGDLTESAAADRLAAFRAEGDRYRGPSFPTISAAGEHGAIVHYRVTAATDRVLQDGSLYLVDSGAQYLDGTTDVTRTVAVGQPSPEMRERFTLVLRGHVALATALFPRGTCGSQLDTLARSAMWRAGLDYDHGTGHGVGCYLGVHEGPQRISKLPNRVALRPGMVVSNEPGYYKPGAYGIRIENLVAVTAAATPAGGEQELLAFETLTLAPIDRRLVVREMLDDDEIAWVDAYHAQVMARLAPLLDEDTRRWLERETRPL